MASAVTFTVRNNYDDDDDAMRVMVSVVIRSFKRAVGNTVY